MSKTEERQDTAGIDERSREGPERWRERLAGKIKQITTHTITQMRLAEDGDVESGDESNDLRKQHG